MNRVDLSHQLSFEFQPIISGEAPDKSSILSELVRIFSGVYQIYRKRSKKNIDARYFDVSFYKYSALKYTLRIREQSALIRISDFAVNQNREFFELLAHRLWSDLFGLKSPGGYRTMFDDAESRLFESLQRKNAFPGPSKRFDTEGKVYDLQDILRKVSRRFFNGNVSSLKIGWSKAAARQRLGHYDTRAGMIIISKILDSPEVPAYVIEYIIFHETLHHLIQFESTDKGKRYHGRLFRRHEKKFPEYASAVQWLKTDYPLLLRRSGFNRRKK